MTIYMKVTPDRFELPVAIADSIPMLARICNTSEWTIRSSLRRYDKGKVKLRRYVKVEIEEEDNERI